MKARQDANSRYPLIEIFMTLTTDNQQKITETAQIARSAGVDYFSLALGMFTTKELAKESVEQYKQEFGIEPRFYDGFVRDVTRMNPGLIADQIMAVRAQWGSRYKHNPPVRADLSQYFRRPRERLTRRQCISPWLTMQVMPDGEMTFCEDFADLPVGNICARDPLDLWNNEVSRSWRRRIRTVGKFVESRCVAHYL